MRLPPPKNLLELLDRTPPFLVYALAREPKQRKRAPYQVLIERSGLKARTFFRIASALTWKGIPVEWVDAFAKACGVDILRRTKVRDFLAHTQKWNRPFSHLSKPQYERFKRQCEEWAELKRKKAVDPQPPPQS